ncbi:cell division control protein 14, SIN component-domain-containing protein [Crepidotus variabilis]|uniref:Cell division control protein 14, SIN component-domain-containing protein n=1 Tax=Crepidotus variabilis TaxID=179855 RepID=A0A9P6ETY8_9AGAR|nr:cell division control protein 14, SIN component-domain-containing protein [Crepidotus variabilis]
MTFEEVLSEMRENIQISLDELSSTRSSPSSKTKALKELEKQLAWASFGNQSDAQDAFQALQYTFECNIPSHLLPWLTLSTFRLEGLTSKSLSQDEREAEMDQLMSQLNLSLSLIQGVVLNHESSKRYLGRRPSLEILLDLLLASRHVPCQPDGEAKASNGVPHITSTIIDTLLCILVDETTSLRAFEEVNGVQAVVKILKRAGTPREVRMKCLEFLYFYLLDETPSDASEKVSITALLQSTSPPSTAPATPIRPSHKPYFSGTPLRPMSRYGSSTFSFVSESSNSSSNNSRPPSDSKSSAKSLRSVSGGSTRSFSSTSSNASSSSSTSTTPSSVGGDSPVKESPSPEIPSKVPRTPARVFSPPPTSGLEPLVSLVTKTTPRSPVKPTSQRLITPPSQTLLTMSNATSSVERSERVKSSIFQPAQSRPLSMLQKEVDYVPMSPKKVLVVGVGKPPIGNSGGEGAERVVSPLGSDREKRRLHRKSLSTSSSSALAPRKKLDSERFPAVPLTPKRTTGSMPNKEGSLESILHQEIKEKLEKAKGREGGDKHDKENVGGSGQWKTTEEKKELLGTMLGNVDALVEGVRKAGIFGLA